jgi:hypothetical protein
VHEVDIRNEFPSKGKHPEEVITAKGSTGQRTDHLLEPRRSRKLKHKEIIEEKGAGKKTAKKQKEASAHSLSKGKKQRKKTRALLYLKCEKKDNIISSTSFFSNTSTQPLFFFTLPFPHIPFLFCFLHLFFTAKFLSSKK